MPDSGRGPLRMRASVDVKTEGWAMDRSQMEIDKWSRIIEHDIHGPNHATAVDRLRAYVCSLYLGRDFGETCDAYMERTGMVDFEFWANSITKA